MTEPKDVKVFTQPYREAKESGIVSDLELVCMVTGSNEVAKPKNPFDHRSVNIAEMCMKIQAAKEDCKYIFGADYRVEHLDDSYVLYGSGDAYKEKNQRKEDIAYRATHHP